jgi:hypothetical protein
MLDFLRNREAKGNNGRIVHDMSLLHYADEDLKKDRDVVLAVVKRDPRTILFSKFRCDKDVVLEALMSDGELFYSDICESLRNDKEFAVKVLEQKPGRYNIFSRDSLGDDEDLKRIVKNKRNMGPGSIAKPKKA